MINDKYYKTGAEFKRPLTNKEVSGKVGGFFKVTWKKANFLYINLFIFLIYLFSSLATFNWSMVTNILYSSVTIGICAIGVSLIIIGGDIDLSVGSIFALDAGLSVLVYNSAYASLGKNSLIALFITLVFSLIFGLVLGAINGFFVGKLKMPSFIATLATMLIFRSIIVYTLSSQPDKPSTFRITGYGGDNDVLYAMGNNKIATLSIVGICFIAIALIFWAITKFTKFGRKIYAVGSNAKAASLIGINVGNTKMIVFALEGMLIGFAAFLQLGIRGSIDPSSAGNSYELYSIASNVLGGISMAGGSGTLIGVIFGTLAFQTIDKIIAALHLNANLNDTIKGAIILIAIIFQILHFSNESFSSFLQKIHLKYDPYYDLKLEGTKQEKIDKIKKNYLAKCQKANSKAVSEEEAKEKVIALLKERDEKIEKLTDTYDLKIFEAKLHIAEVNEKNANQKAINEKKQQLENEKAYFTYLVNEEKKKGHGKLAPSLVVENEKKNEYLQDEHEANIEMINIEAVHNVKSQNIQIKKKKYDNDPSKQELIIKEEKEVCDIDISKDEKIKDENERYQNSLNKLLTYDYPTKIANQTKTDETVVVSTEEKKKINLKELFKKKPKKTKTINKAAKDNQKRLDTIIEDYEKTHQQKRQSF